MQQPSTVGVVGLGLIGGSLALALRRARPELRILGVDADARARELALAAKAIDEAASLEEARFEPCDLVVLATPPQALLQLVLPVAARMRPGAVLTDVCGAKERVCAAAAAQDRVVFVGAHPMAGTEYRGFAAANAALFAGCTVAVTPAAGAREGREDAVAQVRALWVAAGAEKIVDVDAAVHDRAVTFASHLPYLAAAAVVESMIHHAGEASQLARELAAGGFRDTTRLAGDGTVGGAAALNRFIPEEARALADRLRSLARDLEANPEAVLDRLGQLADHRRRMPLPPPPSRPR